MTIENAIKYKQGRAAALKEKTARFKSIPRGRALSASEKRTIAASNMDYKAMLAIDEYLIGYQTILLHIKKQK